MNINYNKNKLTLQVLMKLPWQKIKNQSKLQAGLQTVYKKS